MEPSPQQTRDQEEKSMKIDDEAYLVAAVNIFGQMFKKEQVDTRNVKEIEKSAKHVALIAKILKAELGEGQPAD
jgi:hypothetical protein